MRIIRLLLAKCRALIRRDVVAGEIRDEMQFHLEMRAEELQRKGLLPDEARLAASRRFGNLTLMQDRGYDVRGGGVLETVIQDVRYGLRILLRNRTFSTIAILTLAIGIGVSTALFSVIDAALLRALPYPHPEQLVTIVVREAASKEPKGYGLVPSMADIRAWRSSSHVLAHVGAGRVTGFLPRIVDAGEPERLIVGDASEDFLEVYGIQPIIGRAIQVEDTREGAPLVALLGYAYWRGHFGAATDVVGRVLRIDGKPATIVGVLPAGFYRETAVWKPNSVLRSRENWRGSGTPVDARLQTGVTVEQAERELSGISRGIASFGDSGNVRVDLVSMYDDQTGGSRKTLGTLAWAVSLILLIACVNVAGLLLARGAIRAPELAIRASIGAGRARLVRQLLTESLILAVFGGVAGVTMAWLALDALVALIPISLPSNSPVAVNLRVLAFSAVLSVVSSIAFGLVPALRISSARLGVQLASAGRRHGSALSRRGGQLLIAAEVALAVVLLSGAGLMVRSFARMTAVDVGFDPAAVVTMETEPVDPAPQVRQLYYPALLDAVRAMPEVAAAGAIDYLPLHDGFTSTNVKGDHEMVSVSQVLPGYFEAMGQPIKQGRVPAEADRTGAERVIVINEAAARRYFPDRPAIGEFLQLIGQDEVPLRVIGVVGNVRHYGPEDGAMPAIYRLYAQTSRPPTEPMRITVRSRPPARLSVERLRAAAQAVGPKVLVGRIRSGADDFSDTVITPRRRTLLLSLLGGLGLLLTLVGISSVTAYAVARRTQEIGVRMAFGADAADVILTMMRDAAWPAFLGLFAGMAAAFYATRVIVSFLFDTTVHDPATFAGVAAVMGVATLIAAWIPARRAARVDPVIALRAE